MADNTTVINPSALNASGDVIRTIDESGIKTQVVALAGQNDAGTLALVPVTGEGHLEVAIHSPRMPFGEVHVESLRPIFQVDDVYGINQFEVVPTTGINGPGSTSGTVTAGSNLFTCSTGTTALSFSTLQSRKRLRYRPGQGVVCRFTALFSTPAASSILVAGVGTAESGFYFGYNGTSFGVLHSTGGVREVQTLTITTASTATNNYQVELAGTTFAVTATNNASTVKTAYEIAQGTYTGWSCYPIGSTVVFVANSVGNKTGSFSLGQSGAATPAVGSFAETVAGVAATDTWVPQSQWNGDKLDGTGPSGVTLDPTKGNVFQIDIQYLGFGGVTMKVETSNAGNNPDFVTAHSFAFPNSRTTPSVSQPSFPFTMAAYSAGSTTNVSVSSASFAGFVAGEKRLTGPRMTYQRSSNNFVGSVASTYYPLLTVRNNLTYATRANQAVVNVLSMSASHDDATPVTFYLLRNATLTGTPNFANFATTSCTSWDTAAATATISSNDQIIFSLNIGQNGNATFAFSDDITIQPGETLTLAATAVTGTATYVLGSLNTREDQ